MTRRGWIAVSAAGLHGQGLHRRNVFFTDTGRNEGSGGGQAVRQTKSPAAKRAGSEAGNRRTL